VKLKDCSCNNRVQLLQERYLKFARFWATNSSVCSHLQSYTLPYSWFDSIRYSSLSTFFPFVTNLQQKWLMINANIVKFEPSTPPPPLNSYYLTFIKWNFFSIQFNVSPSRTTNYLTFGFTNKVPYSFFRGLSNAQIIYHAMVLNVWHDNNKKS
jgi:hypothetical protein